MFRDATSEALEEVLLDRCDPIPVCLRDPTFTHQNNFIDDPSKLKALFCTRRAAKSYTGGIGLFEAALNEAGCSTLYIALTKDSARNIMWKDVLKKINREKQLRASFNETRLTCTLSNGSVVYLTGVDADEKEMEKLLGQKYRRVVLDEASLYSIDLRKLVYGILKPAIADYRGDIWLLGTAGDLTQGLFYDITQGLEAGWTLSQWTAFDNPHVARQWQEELDEIDRLRPLFKQTNLYKQWYLNQWVVDENRLVYRYAERRNDFSMLPRYGAGEWQYVLGVDLGYSPDPSAFAVGAFHPFDRVLYGLESDKELEMDITAVANRIKWYLSRYPFFKIVVDGANKQAVQEIQNRHDIALSAADKRGKADFIAIMNAEFVQEQIKINPAQNQKLISEWQKLVWKTIGDKILFPREEHENFPNHCSDSFLYMWRYCYTFMAESPKPKLKIETQAQHIAYQEKQLQQTLEREIEHQKAKENEEDFLALSNLDPFEDQGAILREFINKRRGR